LRPTFLSSKGKSEFERFGPTRKTIFNAGTKGSMVYCGGEIKQAEEEKEWVPGLRLDI
jgi:hypothetical protein